MSPKDADKARVAAGKIIEILSPLDPTARWRVLKSACILLGIPEHIAGPEPEEEDDE